MSCIINWALFLIISLWLGLFSACNWGNVMIALTFDFHVVTEGQKKQARPRKVKRKDMKHWDSFYLLFLPQDAHNLPNLCPNLNLDADIWVPLSSCQSKIFLYFWKMEWSLFLFEVSVLVSSLQIHSSSGLSSVPHWMTSTSFEIH